MATGAHPDTLGRKLARQNAAELAALADATPAQHIAAFAASARRYAARLGAVWELPHHQYRETVVTVGGMAGAASAEWHLHAWDLAMALGADYRPADPAVVLAGWLAGMPQLPFPPARSHGGWSTRHPDPWHAVLAVSGRRPPGSHARTRPAQWGPRRGGRRDRRPSRRGRARAEHDHLDLPGRWCTGQHVGRRGRGNRVPARP